MELGLEVRSVSIIGGFGLLDGLEFRDIVDGDLEEGKEDKDVLRLLAMALPLELEAVAVAVSAVPMVPLVVGRCMATFVAFDLK